MGQLLVRNDESAFSIGRFKEAALFFDHILPLVGEESEIDPYAPYLLPPGVSLATLKHASFEITVKAIATAPEMLLKWDFPPSVSPNLRHAKEQLGPDQFIAEYREAFLLVAQKDTPGVDALLRELRGRPVTVLADPYAEEPSDKSQTISVVLANLPLVKTHDLSWERIVDFRTDEDSRRKLKRLRTFVFEKFDGKPLAYIEDALGLAIYDYQQASKKWGMDTALSSLTVGGLEKLFAGTAASVSTAFLGASMPVSAAVGLSAYVGTVAVSIVSSFRSRLTEIATHPLSYVVDINNEVGRAASDNRRLRIDGSSE